MASNVDSYCSSTAVSPTAATSALFDRMDMGDTRGSQTSVSSTSVYGPDTSMKEDDRTGSECINGTPLLAGSGTPQEDEDVDMELDSDEEYSQMIGLGNSTHQANTVSSVENRNQQISGPILVPKALTVPNPTSTMSEPSDIPSLAAAVARFSTQNAFDQPQMKDEPPSNSILSIRRGLLGKSREMEVSVIGEAPALVTATSVHGVLYRQPSPPPAHHDVQRPEPPALKVISNTLDIVSLAAAAAEYTARNKTLVEMKPRTIETENGRLGTAFIDSAEINAHAESSKTTSLSLTQGMKFHRPTKSATNLLRVPTQLNLSSLVQAATAFVTRSPDIATPLAASTSALDWSPSYDDNRNDTPPRLSSHDHVIVSPFTAGVSMAAAHEIPSVDSARPSVSSSDGATTLLVIPKEATRSSITSENTRYRSTSISSTARSASPVDLDDIEALTRQEVSSSTTTSISFASSSPIFADYESAETTLDGLSLPSRDIPFAEGNPPVVSANTSERKFPKGDVIARLGSHTVHAAPLPPSKISPLPTGPRALSATWPKQQPPAATSNALPKLPPTASKAIPSLPMRDPPKAPRSMRTVSSTLPVTGPRSLEHSASASSTTTPSTMISSTGNISSMKVESANKHKGLLTSSPSKDEFITSSPGLSFTTKSADESG